MVITELGNSLEQLSIRVFGRHDIASVNMTRKRSNIYLARLSSSVRTMYLQLSVL